LFPWLWRKLKDPLLDSKEDENAAAVDGALKAGPKTAVKAAVNVANPEVQTSEANAETPPTPGLAAPLRHRTKGTDTRTPEQKAKTPCNFFFKLGECKAGSDCAYSLTEAPPKQGAQNEKPKGQPPRNPSAQASGGVALIAGLTGLVNANATRVQPKAAANSLKV